MPAPGTSRVLSSSVRVFNLAGRVVLPTLDERLGWFDAWPAFSRSGSVCIGGMRVLNVASPVLPSHSSKRNPEKIFVDTTARGRTGSSRVSAAERCRFHRSVAEIGRELVPPVLAAFDQSGGDTIPGDSSFQATRSRRQPSYQSGQVANVGIEFATLRTPRGSEAVNIVKAGYPVGTDSGQGMRDKAKDPREHIAFGPHKINLVAANRDMPTTEYVLEYKGERIDEDFADSPPGSRGRVAEFPHPQDRTEHATVRPIPSVLSETLRPHVLWLWQGGYLRRPDPADMVVFPVIPAARRLSTWLSE